MTFTAIAANTRRRNGLISAYQCRYAEGVLPRWDRWTERRSAMNRLVW